MVHSHCLCLFGEMEIEMNHNFLYHPIQYINRLESYRNYIVQPQDPIYGIVWEFYEFDTTEIVKDHIFCIPDVCPDVVFALKENGEGSYLHGNYSGIQKQIYPNKTKIFGARFVSGTFNQISDIPISDYMNQKINIFDVCDKARAYYDLLCEKDTFEERVASTIKFLLSNYKRSDNDKLIHHMIEQIIYSRGNISVKELSQKLCYSERYINKKINEYTGISPKQLSRIIKFQMTLHHFINDQNLSMEDLALRSGYYDLSHMTKSFKDITGQTPMDFLESIRDVKLETL